MTIPHLDGNCPTLPAIKERGIQVLKMRLDKGEITRAEFDRIKTVVDLTEPNYT